MQTCTWYVDVTDIQGPALVLGYEVATNAGPAAYLKTRPQQNLAKPVPAVGDVAIILNGIAQTLDGVSGNTIFHVRVQLYDPSVDTKHQPALVVQAATPVVGRLPH